MLPSSNLTINNQLPIAPDVSQTVRTEVNHFASRTEGLAQEILEKNSSSRDSGRSVIIRHHYYSPWYTPMWFWPEPVYVVPARSGRDQENEMRCLVGVLATIVGGIALFAIGSAIPRYNDSVREFKDARHFNHKLDSLNAAPQEQPFIEEAKHISQLKERICQRIKNSALTDLILRIGVAAGCGMALAGAIAASSAWITAGLVTTVVVSSFMLFKWGYDLSDKSNIRDAQEVVNAVHRLQSL